MKTLPAKKVSVEHNGSNRGAITRLFGVILIFLGTLDSMLSWRGGFAVSDFYVVLIGAGIALYILGSLARQRGE